MRKDPPYDLAYITCTWLLESAETKGVKILNSPSALRDFNEKLAIFQFPEFIRDGLVSTQTKEFLEFLSQKAGGDAILKPLTLFGGRGVLRLNGSEMTESQIKQILDEETQHGEQHRLMQPFDTKIFEGEVRAFTAGGNAIAWCLKMPSGENFLANTRSGATLQSYQPTDADRAMVNHISQELLRKGVFYVGFDIIGGKVSEINITSPRLLHGPTDTADYYQKIAELIEKYLEKAV
jgi:glutathione synthase